MCLSFKQNNKPTKKPVNRFLQDDANAGIRSLQTSVTNFNDKRTVVINNNAGK